MNSRSLFKRSRRRLATSSEWRPQITDEHIATFASESTWDGLADALVETNGEIAMRIALYIAPSAITSARAMLRRRATHIEPMTLAPITSCAQTVPVARVW